MDITVVGRNAEISSRLRDYVEDKAVKVEQFDPRVQRVEVEVTHERNPRQADTAERVEITVVSKGPVIRAEASSSSRTSPSFPRPVTRRSRTPPPPPPSPVWRLRPSSATPR